MALDRTNSDVVLIVDDVPDNLSLLHDALDEAGYTVLVATHGEAALQRAAQALPDIVLLDAMMPGMDGFEVARRLKALPATAHIPIIFMTGLTETEHLALQLCSGQRLPVAWDRDPPKLELADGPRLLTLRLHRPTEDSDGCDWLVVMRETSEEAVLLAMADAFKLTAREAEVLYWVVKGKVNRDIGDILGTSPATVKKHLERIYVKLGVETRTAAAGLAMTRITRLHPARAT